MFLSKLGFFRFIFIFIFISIIFLFYLFFFLPSSPGFEIRWLIAFSFFFFIFFKSLRRLKRQAKKLVSIHPPPST